MLRKFITISCFAILFLQTHSKCCKCSKKCNKKKPETIPEIPEPFDSEQNNFEQPDYGDNGERQTYSQENERGEPLTPNKNLSKGQDNCNNCTANDKPEEWKGLNICFKMHETNDNKFYKCVHGVAYPYDCPGETRWDHGLLTCVH